MFDKLKKIKELKDQAKILKDSLNQEVVAVEKDGVKLVMNGHQEVLSLSLPKDLDQTELEKILPEIFNEGVKRVQRLIFSKMQAGNFNLPDWR